MHLCSSSSISSSDEWENEKTMDYDSLYANFSNASGGIRKNVITLSVTYRNLERFYSNFQPIYKYLCLTICLAGILANAIVIVVLSNRRMRSTANRILRLIAIFDLILMISFLAYLTHSEFLTYSCEADGFSYPWTCFKLIHANLSVFCKACSLYSSVILAIYRRQLLANPTPVVTSTLAAITTGGRQSHSNLHGTVTKMIVTFYAGILSCCLPSFFSFVIIEDVVPDENLGTCPNGTKAYFIKPSEITEYYDCLMEKFNFWIHGLIFKFLPCLTIAICLIWIIVLMLNRSKRKKRQFHTKTQQNRRNSVKRTQRTTLLLTLILTLTLICETPCAVVNVLAGIFDKQFFKYVYRNLGDFFDTLSLLNGTTTFALYCLMNSGFRDTFSKIFLPKCKNKKGKFIRNSFVAVSVEVIT